MRIIAWCILLAALIFAGASNRLDENAFEDSSTTGMSPMTSTLNQYGSGGHGPVTLGTK